MSFLSTVLLFAAVVSGILLPIFVGHGLAAHDTGRILVGVGFAVASAICVFLYSRVARRTEAATDRH